MSDEARIAVQQLISASQRLRNATEQHIGAIMDLLDGANLRRAYSSDLKRLKRRLRKFNMNTGQWSE